MNTQQNKVVKWSSAEENQLLQEIKDGLDEETIARNHQRSVGAIKIRLKKIALKMKNDDIPIEEIKEATGISEEEIEEQKKIESKQKDSSSDTKKLNIIKRRLQDIVDLL